MSQVQVKVKETVDEQEETNTEVGEKIMEKKNSIGCLPIKSCLWRRKHEKEYKHIPRKQKKNIFPLPC